MTRTAEYTIQGFLYQFNKTLLEILQSTDDSQITAEGIIEDIVLSAPLGTTAIQCKYHEARANFSLSLVYKPILQMMEHYFRNKNAPIRYILFAHFPNAFLGPHLLSRADIESILNSSNPKLAKYIAPLKGNIDIDEFLKRFTLEFGCSFDALVSDVHTALSGNGLPAEEIETLMYPNAIHYVATLCTNHLEEDRTITKPKLLETLQQIRKTAISRWTLSLKTRKQILEARRKQLKANLDINTRLRYLLIYGSLESFQDDIVLFIHDFVGKYHFKSAHIRTPVFCLDCREEEFDSIRFRLYQKGITAADGFVGSKFESAKFFKEPMRTKLANKEIQREFVVRLLRFNPAQPVMNEQKCDDLFIIGTGAEHGLDTLDINVEHLDVSDLKQVRYLVGVSNAYE